MGVPGVANVAIYGQRDRQLQVQADPVRMQARQVSLTEITTTAANALWVSPLSFVQASTPGTGGFLESPNQRLAVQHILPISSAADLAAVPVAGPHPGVKLGDVANVVTDHQPLVGDAVAADASSLVLVVERFPGASTEQVTKGVEEALDALRPGLTGVSIDTGLYRPATYLDAATGTIGLVGALGLALVVLVVLALSWSWRRAAVTVGVLLLSLVAGASILAVSGAGFTSMTLVGLAAALAVLVDDVVSDVDAAQRRLDRAADQSKGARLAAVTKAAVTSRRRLGASLLVVPVLAVPVLFVGPFQSSFSRPLVVSYLVATAVSALVALLVTPTVCLLVLRGRPTGRSPLLRAGRAGVPTAAGAGARHAQDDTRRGGGARRRGRMLRPGSGRHVGASRSAGPEPARPSPVDAGHLAAGDGPHHHRRRPRAARCRWRRRHRHTRRPRRDVRPGCRRQLERAVGQPGPVRRLRARPVQRRDRRQGLPGPCGQRDHLPGRPARRRPPGQPRGRRRPGLRQRPRRPADHRPPRPERRPRESPASARRPWRPSSNSRPPRSSSTSRPPRDTAYDPEMCAARRRR